jgi:hypothetical protein
VCRYYKANESYFHATLPGVVNGTLDTFYLRVSGGGLGSQPLPWPCNGSNTLDGSNMLDGAVAAVSDGTTCSAAGLEHGAVWKLNPRSKHTTMAQVLDVTFANNASDSRSIQTEIVIICSPDTHSKPPISVARKKKPNQYAVQVVSSLACPNDSPPAPPPGPPGPSHRCTSRLIWCLHVHARLIS